MMRPPDATAVVDREWFMIIDNRPVGAVDGGRLEVVNPATGQVVTTIPAATEADVDAAVASAKNAFDGWKRTPAVVRARLLNEIADAVETHGEELARIDAIDNGTPISMLRNDIRLATTQLRYFAGLALELRGQSIPRPRAG